MNLREAGIVTIAVSFILAALTSSSLGGPNSMAYASVHVVPYDDLTGCPVNCQCITDPWDIITTYGACDGAYVAVVFYDIYECMGLEYGLTWPGTGPAAFTSCSDFSVGNITQPGDGIMQGWSSCQTDRVIVTCYGWIDISGPGFVHVVPYPDMGSVGIIDCSEVRDEVERLTWSGLCGETGDEPYGFWTGPALLLYMTHDGPECVTSGDTLRYTISYETRPYNPVDVHNVSIINYMPGELAYVSASDGGVYDAAIHTVTWQVGTVPIDGSGSVEFLASVSPGVPPGRTLRNTCGILSGDGTIAAAGDSTSSCPSATAATTWGRIKSLFR